MDMNKPGKPEKAETPKADTDEYEFNLGLYRIETLSEILEVCAKKYRRAIMQRDEQSVQDYQAMVNLLYTETYIYMQDETGVEIKNVEQKKDDLLEDYLDDFQRISGEEEVMKRLKQVREIYLAVRNLLQEVGIDIPRKEKMKPTETFSQT